jgi:hypothetical protein
MRYIFSLILALLPLAYAQTPFPIAFKTVNSAQASSISSLASSYAISVEQQPAFTTFSAYMATATGLSQDGSDAFNEADYNPILLANEFFTATATPAWYTEIPSSLQSYVSSVANSEASIVARVAGDAKRLGTRAAVVGALLTTALVGILML